MFKVLINFLIVLFFLLAAPVSLAAQSNSFVTVINPVRGADFWDDKTQTPQTAVSGQMEILKKSNVPATWLIRVDGLKDNGLVNIYDANSSDTEVEAIYFNATNDISNFDNLYQAVVKFIEWYNKKR